MSKQDRTQARSKAPVSSHPLFPAIVALWFGALFGLGSLAVRPSILESLVLSSHLDVILPMTAPPLGATARILLALTMAVIGIAIGAMIARHIARPKPAKRQRRRDASAVADKPRGRFGAVYADAPQPQPAPQTAPSGRRRALAVEPEEREDYRLHAAPLPGGAPAIFDVTQIDMAEPESAATQGAGPEQAELLSQPQPLELNSFAAPEPAVAESCASHPAAPPAPDDCLELNTFVEAPEQRQVFGRSQFVSGDPVEQNSAPAAPADFAAALPAHQDFTPQSFAPAPPLPVATPVLDNPAMTAFEANPEPRRFDGPADAGMFGAAAGQPLAAQPALSQPTEPEAVAEPMPQAAPAPAAGLNQVPDSAAQRIASANLAELSPVELIERFALALQQRRSSGAVPTGLAEAAASFVPAQPAPIPASMPIEFSPTPAEAAPLAAAPSPLTLPAALRPIDFSEYDDHDDYHSHVPARSMTMPAPAEAAAPLAESANIPAEVEAEAETEVLDEGYSSLLDLTRPAPLRQSFVRIEEPMEESGPVEPVVIFPGQESRAGTRFARPSEVATPVAVQAAAEPAAQQAGVTQLRRFDAPNATAPAAPAAAASPQDPEEAERALRSALATLQRMSGAA